MTQQRQCPECGQPEIDNCGWCGQNPFYRPSAPWILLKGSGVLCALCGETEEFALPAPIPVVLLQGCLFADRHARCGRERGLTRNGARMANAISYACAIVAGWRPEGAP